MATVTTAQLKTTINAALVAAGITGVSLFDFPRPPQRRIFPSVEIKATQPQGTESDARVTNILQRFDIVVRVKQRGGGTDETAFLKSIEDTILPALDATALGQTTIFVLNKNWNRQGELVAKPVNHLMSSLVVLTTDVTSTTGDGKIGAKTTLTLPDTTVIPLLSKPVEDYGISMDEDLNDGGLSYKTPMAHTTFGSIVVEYESTTALASKIKTLIDAKAKITVTLTKNGDATTHDVLFVRTSKPAQFDDVERAVLTMELTS